MAVRWTIPFRTINEEAARVDIYDAEWSGGTTTLTGGVQPIVTEEDDDEDLLMPVRKQTGYLNVVGGDLPDELSPSEVMKLRVVLVVGGVVRWQGWIQPFFFDRSMYGPTDEMSLPIVSAISALESVEMDKEDDNLGMVSLGELVGEAIDATGATYTRVWFPQEVKYLGDYTAAWRLEVMRSTMFERNQKESGNVQLDYTKYTRPTMLKVLSNVAELFGWVVYERGTEVYFVSRCVSKYATITVADLKIGNYDNVTTDVAIASHSIADDVYRGTDNTITHIDGYRNVKVVCDINETTTMMSAMGEVRTFPTGEINKFNFSLGTCQFYGLTFKTSEYTSFSCQNYGIEKISDTELDWSVTGSAVTSLEQYFDDSSAPYGVIAVPAYADICNLSDMQGTGGNPPTKRSYDPKEVLVWKCHLPMKSDGLNRVEPTDSDARQHPFFKMRSDFPYVIPGGMMCISIDCDVHYGVPTLNAELRVGNKWWDGSGWRSTRSFFAFSPGNQEPNYFVGYPGVSGEIINVNSTDGLCGIIELTLFPKSEVLVFVESLEIGIFTENDLLSAQVTVNEYGVSTGLSTQNGTKTIEPFACSRAHNKAGKAFLFYGGRYLEDNGVLFDKQKSTQRYRIENHLLDLMKRVYGRKAEKASIDVSVDGQLKPVDKIMTSDGRMFALTSEHVDWRMMRETRTMIELPALQD